MLKFRQAKQKNKKMIRKNKFLVFIAILALFLLNISDARAETSELSSISIQESFQGFFIFWEKPLLSENEDVVLIRKEGSCPISEKDGKEIYVGSRSFFEDLSIEAGKAYCYGALIYDYSGKFSDLKITQTVTKKSHLKYLFDQAIGNVNISFGLIVLIALFWINKVTTKKRIRNNKILMKI
jgi:hypothetical protein